MEVKTKEVIKAGMEDATVCTLYRMKNNARLERRFKHKLVFCGRNLPTKNETWNATTNATRFLRNLYEHLRNFSEEQWEDKLPEILQKMQYRQNIPLLIIVENENEGLGSYRKGTVRIYQQSKLIFEHIDPLRDEELCFAEHNIDPLCINQGTLKGLEATIGKLERAFSSLEELQSTLSEYSKQWTTHHWFWMENLVLEYRGRRPFNKGLAAGGGYENIFVAKLNGVEIPNTAGESYFNFGAAENYKDGDIISIRQLIGWHLSKSHDSYQTDSYVSKSVFGKKYWFKFTNVDLEHIDNSRLD